MSFLLSLPVWGRGLKSQTYVLHLNYTCVAPRVGAWIEIISYPVMQKKEVPSLPVWGRGLK